MMMEKPELSICGQAGIWTWIAGSGLPHRSKMGLTHSFAADEAENVPQRTFSAGLLPEDQSPTKKPRTDALAALKCGADDDLVQKYDELLETFDAEQARFSERLRGLERQHEITMTALAAERDSLQAQLQAK